MLEALQVNGSLSSCLIEGFEREISSSCTRNLSMHERARKSVVCLLALRRTCRVTVFPREMIVMIGQMLMRTKCDIDAWSKRLHEGRIV